MQLRSKEQFPNKYKPSDERAARLLKTTWFKPFAARRTCGRGSGCFTSFKLHCKLANNGLCEPNGIMVSEKEPNLDNLGETVPDIKVLEITIFSSDARKDACEQLREIRNQLLVDRSGAANIPEDIAKERRLTSPTLEKLARCLDQPISPQRQVGTPTEDVTPPDLPSAVAAGCLGPLSTASTR